MPVDKLSKSLRALATADWVKLLSLRFPNYRSVAPDELLEFKFPITVLLGCNGTNKSSILNAIGGSLDRETIADYWFETSLDAIPEKVAGRKQSVTHKYLGEDGSPVECIKARAPRGKGDPDYWEAVKPTTVYGFPRNAKRVPPLDAELLRLDFRSELPAFDKYFYFPDDQHLAQLSKRAKQRATVTLRRSYRKQDYLRRKSSMVVRKLEEDGSDLTAESLDVLSYVLGKRYVAGRYVDHAIYRGHSGRTIRFTLEGAASKYSDAFAGSGESAAAFLILGLLSAKSGSIVLLDEPETSLHPRAQAKLIDVIAHYAVRRKLQVVIATHSPFIAGNLPQEAIRVLYVDSNGQVKISDSHSVNEALHEVADLPPGRTIIVEDERARHVVVSAIRKRRSNSPQSVHVLVRPGGVARIYQDLVAHSLSGRGDLICILDGDQSPVASPSLPI